MKPRTAKRLIAAATIAAVLAIVLTVRSFGPPEYEITDLGFCGRTGHVSAINNAGQVTGWSRYYSGSPERDIAFVWDAVNGRKDLQTPEGKESYGNDINDKGHVVGGLFETAARQRRAFIWDEETGMTELGTLGGSSSEAEAVNNKGQVVGWAETTSGRKHAFIWDKTGGMKDLGTLGGIISLAVDINDKGQVVGLLSLAGGQVRAFIWEQGAGMTDIGTLGGPFSHANAINNSGQVIGTSAKKSGEGAFIWEQGKGITELNLLRGRQHYAREINDQGQIIGGFETRKFPFLKPHEGWYLWDPRRGAIDLDSVAPSKSSLEWVNINDNGQIVAIQPSKSGQNHIIILTPKAISKPTDK